MEDLAIDTVTRIIQSDFPELNISTIKSLGTGWVNIVYLVNGRFVFRLPKNLNSLRWEEDRKRHNETEVKLLRELDGKLPVTTPVPVHVVADFSYFSYRYIPGTPMPYMSESALGLEQQHQLTGLWVEVAASLAQTVSLRQARMIGLASDTDVKNQVKRALGLVTSGFIERSLQKTLKTVCNTYQTSYQTAASRRSVTLHGDLGFKNWLMDNKAQTRAVIDWSSAFIGSPEIQVAKAFMWDSPDFAARAAGLYRNTVDPDFDMNLVYSAGCVGFLNDIAALQEQGLSADDAHIRQMSHSLKQWVLGLS